MEQVVITVTRTEAAERCKNPREHMLEATKIALKQAPMNFGLAEIKSGSMGWRFIFEFARI
jgi:hypothetical protein